MSSHSEVISAAYKLSPAVAVTSASLAGVSLQQWVLVATLVYTVLQILLLIRKWWKEHNESEE